MVSINLAHLAHTVATHLDVDVNDITVATLVPILAVEFLTHDTVKFRDVRGELVLLDRDQFAGLAA